MTLSQTGTMRMRTLRITAIVAAFVALSSCSADVAVPTVANRLNGDWSQSQQVPGSGLHFHLVVVDSTITGTGTYSIEAGQGGTVSVTGVTTGGRIKLTIVRSIGDTLRFDGVATDANDLDGYGFYSASTGLGISDPAPVKFIRVLTL